MLSKTCPERVKKRFKTCFILGRLWGPNVVENGAQNKGFFRFLVFLAQSGPTGISEWILRAKNGAQEVKMGGKI